MRVLLSRLVLVLGVMAAAGCASAGETTDQEFLNPNILTLEQITEAHATNAYEVVERLRGRWLQTRGTSQFGASAGDFQIQAYLDDRKLRGLDDLRSIDVRSVEYIRWYPASEASARWGFDHGAGAILVSTRPLKK